MSPDNIANKSSKNIKAEIIITLKKSVRDPQGQAITQALNRLGFDKAKKVRQGKHIEIELKNMNADEAKAQLQAMCEKFLVNPVIEDYQIKINGQ